MPASVGLILLAAGSSSRMGQPKQLLPYAGTTLLRHAVQTAAATSCSPLVVVLGSESERIAEELQGVAVLTAVNPDWREGMGASIRVGLEAATAAAPALDAVLVMLCDQPLVTPALLETIIAAYDESAAYEPDGDELDIVASEYGSDVGVPALFARSLFPNLLNLAPDEGARRLIVANEERAARVTFPGGATDIDTPSEYNTLLHDEAAMRGEIDDTLGDRAPTAEEQALLGQ